MPPNLPQPLRALQTALAQDGAGLRLLVHAAEPAQIVSLIQQEFEGMTVTGAGEGDDLDLLLAETDPQICLSYRFISPFPRASLLGHSIRYLHVGGTGFDHITPWDPTEVTVCTSAGFQAEMMADYVLGAILAISLRLPAFFEQQKKRQWRPMDLRPLAGTEAVILGTGANGRSIAGRLRNAGITVRGVSRSGRQDAAFDSVHKVGDLPALLPQADHLVIVLPRTPETEGLLSAKLLALLPRHATLVNVARGGILDDDALLDMLTSGRLGGAVLDVFATEPLPADSPLWTAPGLIVTPHSSALFDGWEGAAAQVFLDNLRKIGEGSAPANVKDPNLGY